MRYFFDSSSLAKRYHPEAGSDEVNRIFGQPGRLLFVSKLAMIELISVAGIKQRSGSLNREGAAAFLRRVTVSSTLGDFDVQQLTDEEYSIAARLLLSYSAHHGLRTLDALHLASALRHRAISRLDFFVTSDRTLAMVAALEGFTVIIPEEV